jgi:hypothetical protein
MRWLRSFEEYPSKARALLTGIPQTKGVIQNAGVVQENLLLANCLLFHSRAGGAERTAEMLFFRSNYGKGLQRPAYAWVIC